LGVAEPVRAWDLAGRVEAERRLIDGVSKSKLPKVIDSAYATD
jgi:hypothetical protein